MDYLIKGATIVDARSAHSGKQRDILIQNGLIAKIASRIAAENAEVIRAKDLHVSLGWVDLMASFREPGEEWKETVQSGLDAAAAGGFSHVLVMPDTAPAVQHKGNVDYLTQQAEKHRVSLWACGALSEERQGKQLAGLYDMHQSGAKAFSDHKHPVDRTELMARALEYAQQFDGLVMAFPFDNGLCRNGIMHEGAVSVSLGLSGIPSIAESLRLKRDLEILRYTGGRLHVMLVSTAESVQLIREAKQEGLRVTCGMAAHQLSFTDADMTAFDARWKVLPPFRTSADRIALIQGLQDGTIDAVVSDHSPEDTESKMLELEHASFGFGSMETAFGALRSAAMEELSIEQLIDALSHGPRDILGLPNTFAEGAPADLTLFQPDATWQVAPSGFRSKARLTPFEGMTLTGKVLGLLPEA